MADITKTTTIAVDCTDGLAIGLTATAERELTADNLKVAGSLSVASDVEVAIDIGAIDPSALSWLTVLNAGVDPITIMANSVAITGNIGEGECASLPPTPHAAGFGVKKPTHTVTTKVHYVAYGPTTKAA
jgi:hypothetical protein